MTTHNMKVLLDKKLLRQIKQEGINVIDYDNELVTNALVADYNKSHEIPLDLLENNDLFTRLQELQHLAIKLNTLFPEYYRDEYYGYSGEYYDILDEIDDRYDSYSHHRHEYDW